MLDILHPLSNDIMVEALPDQWIPAVPYPWFTSHWLFWWRARCVCGKKFENIELYEVHYRAAHKEEQYYLKKLEEVKDGRGEVTAVYRKRTN